MQSHTNNRLVGLGLSVYFSTDSIHQEVSIPLLQDDIRNMATKLPQVSDQQEETLSEVSENQLKVAIQSGLAGLASVKSLATLEENLIK